MTQRFTATNRTPLNTLRAFTVGSSARIEPSPVTVAGEGEGDGMKIEVDIGWIEEGGDVEAEIRERVIESVAQKIEKGMSPDVSEMVHVRAAEVIDEQLRPLVQSILKEPIQLYTRYGDAQGEPMTVRAMAVKKLEELMTGEKRRDGFSHRNESGQNLNQLLADFLSYELKAEIQKASKEANRRVTEAIQKHGAEVIAGLSKSLAENLRR